MVHEHTHTYTHLCEYTTYIHNNYTLSADVDECLIDILNNCPENSECTNTPGSFICTCTNGFAMEGSVCQGETPYIYILSTYIYIYMHSVHTVCIVHNN